MAVERVKAGKEPPLQLATSEEELEMERLEMVDAENELLVARKSLSAIWGAESAGSDAVEGLLDEVPADVPAFANREESRPCPRGNRDRPVAELPYAPAPPRMRRIKNRIEEHQSAWLSKN